MKNCLSLFILPLLLLGLISLNANAHEESKMYMKKYAIGKTANLIVDTEFADVNIVNHDKAEIVMEVNVTVKSSKPDKAKKVVENIKVNMEKSGDDVSLDIDLTNNVSNVELDIVATIHAPAYINLNAEMEYGKLNLGELTGTCALELDYGALTIGKLLNERGQNMLELEYCDPAIIGIIKKGVIEADYSEVKVKAAGDLRFEGDYSELVIGKGIILHAEMDYGSIAAEEIGGVLFSGDYVTAQFDEILERAVITMDYGSLLIKSLANNFEKLQLTADFLDATIKTGKLKEFVISGMLEFSDVKVPGFVKKKKVDFTGTSLSGGSGKARFDITMDYGSLSIVE